MTWLEVFQAQQARNKPGNRVQVATVDEHGAPSIRTVVLRGFTHDGQPWFFTDGRSLKVQHLQRTSQVSLLVWWERTDDQFRIDGRASLHGADASGAPAVLRRTSWQRLSGRREAWLGPAPGSILGTSSPARPDTPEPPDTFVVVTVDVECVDWLRLGATHTRVRFKRAGATWVRDELVP